MSVWYSGDQCMVHGAQVGGQVHTGGRLIHMKQTVVVFWMKLGLKSVNTEDSEPHLC